MSNEFLSFIEFLQANPHWSAKAVINFFGALFCYLQVRKNGITIKEGIILALAVSAIFIDGILK